MRVGARAPVSFRHVSNTGVLAALLLLLFETSICCAQDAMPRVLVPGYRLQLIAQAPDIVTPIAAIYDDRDRLLVIESHTHQTPDDYEGPKFDRIRQLIDENGDGVSDRVSNFFEGTRHTMSLLAGRDHWIYVATRREVFQIRDSDGDGTADQRRSLVRLATLGDYPHNGLAGLTFEPNGGLLFGMGENLGERYELVGADGTVIKGGGEGGNIFRCSIDGHGLERVATGFWNPFGNGYDTAGRLFTVDNDPDASPPCRLLHVAETGDYGYQFRFGRSGRHPLQAWDAELPGTLPMAAGTGEAPCQILLYRGRLWVSSWGDYRIEAYTIRPVGATCQATQQVIVQGDRRFRPVGLAAAPDGSLVVTDWVDRSYPVHGEGRIWRLIPDHVDAEHHEAVVPARAADEQRARHAVAHPRWGHLDDDDAFIRQAAVDGFSRRGDLLTATGWYDLTSPAQRLGFLQAHRWRSAESVRQWLPTALNAAADSLRVYAMRVIAEDNLQSFRPAIEQRLTDPRGLSERELRVALATLGWLDTHEASRDSTALNLRLAELLHDSDAPLSLRRLALQWLPKDSDVVSVDQLRNLFQTSPGLREELVASLFDPPADSDGALSMLAVGGQ